MRIRLEAKFAIFAKVSRPRTFLANGLRLTGNPQIAGAPTVLIVGDSHVEAFQVPDEETMGSALERRLRSEGKQWNALQYGWSGADGPDYVYSAPLLLEKFPTQHIFLIMNDGDFRSLAGEEARMVERDGVLTAEPLTPGMPQGRAPSYGGRLARKMKESGLIYGAALRFQLDLKPEFTEHKASAQDGAVPAAADPKRHDGADRSRLAAGLRRQTLHCVYAVAAVFGGRSGGSAGELCCWRSAQRKRWRAGACASGW